MASEYVYVKGKTKWFRHNAPDLEYKKWNHVMYLDTESLEKVRELQARGLKNHLKKDEDGWYVSWSRPTEKTIKGKVVGFQPPDVFFSDGVTPMRNVNIGNGSDVTTKLEIYPFKHGNNKGIAARWVSSRVDNLVPFDNNKSHLTDRESQSADGLSEQPAPLF